MGKTSDRKRFVLTCYNEKLLELRRQNKRPDRGLYANVNNSKLLLFVHYGNEQFETVKKIVPKNMKIDEVPKIFSYATPYTPDVALRILDWFYETLREFKDVRNYPIVISNDSGINIGKYAVEKDATSGRGNRVVLLSLDEFNAKKEVWNAEIVNIICMENVVLETNCNTFSKIIYVTNDTKLELVDFEKNYFEHIKPTDTKILQQIITTEFDVADAVREMQQDLFPNGNCLLCLYWMVGNIYFLIDLPCNDSGTGGDLPCNDSSLWDLLCNDSGAFGDLPCNTENMEKGENNAPIGIYFLHDYILQL